MQRIGGDDTGGEHGDRERRADRSTARRDRGIRVLYGDVLRENTTMLRLCDVLGFKRQSVEGEPSLVRVVLELS